MRISTAKSRQSTVRVSRTSNISREMSPESHASRTSTDFWLFVLPPTTRSSSSSCFQFSLEPPQCSSPRTFLNQPPEARLPQWEPHVSSQSPRGHSLAVHLLSKQCSTLSEYRELLLAFPRRIWKIQPVSSSAPVTETWRPLRPFGGNGN